jgi:tellurite resistance protein
MWLESRPRGGEDSGVTPGEKNIVKSLIAVAWADGRMESAESSVIEGLLSGFDASDEEEAELLEYARTRRTLEADVPLAELDPEERELLFANAVLLSHADGEQSPRERAALDALAELLGLEREMREQIAGAVQRKGGDGVSG